MTEHMSTGPHDAAAYRITKAMANRCVAEHGAESSTALAARLVDTLLELASCPHCTEHVPDLVAVNALMPDTATLIILHMLHALYAANEGLIKASNNFIDLPPDIQDEMRKMAGQTIPDFAPEG